MGTTADKLQAIIDSKEAIRTAINNKGGSISENTPLDEYATEINSLPDTTTAVADILNGTVVNLSNNYVTKLQQYIFQNSSTLRTVNLPNVTNINLNGYQFNNCINLETVVLGTLTGGLGLSVCRGCTSLTSFVFSGGDNNAISSNAFYDCTSLQNINIHNYKTISANTFYGCTSLQSITIEKSDNVCTLNNVNAIPTGQNIIIYVPSDLISSYQTASNWTTLYNNGDVTFVAIP